MSPDQPRDQGLNERVKRFTAQTPKLRLLPPAAMTHEHKMENTNAPRKTQYQAE